MTPVQRHLRHRRPLVWVQRSTACQDRYKPHGSDSMYEGTWTTFCKAKAGDRTGKQMNISQPCCCCNTCFHHINTTFSSQRDGAKEEKASGEAAALWRKMPLLMSGVRGQGGQTGWREQGLEHGYKFRFKCAQYFNVLIYEVDM